MPPSNQYSRRRKVWLRPGKISKYVADGAEELTMFSDQKLGGYWKVTPT